MLEIQGFPPIADSHAAVLILGTMPSVASLAKHQYYGHRQNAFWPIMGALFGAYPTLDYELRKRILQQNRVALWDVLARCCRPGSADSAIEKSSIITNDFEAFFQSHAAIRRVYFNGAGAETLYKKYVLPWLPEDAAMLHYQRLPSTSPAYAAMTLQQKTDAWRIRLSADDQ